MYVILNLWDVFTKNGKIVVACQGKVTF